MSKVAPLSSPDLTGWLCSGLGLQTVGAKIQGFHLGVIALRGELGPVERAFYPADIPCFDDDFLLRLHGFLCWRGLFLVRYHLFLVGYRIVVLCWGLGC